MAVSAAAKMQLWQSKRCTASFKDSSYRPLFVVFALLVNVVGALSSAGKTAEPLYGGLSACAWFTATVVSRSVSAAGPQSEFMSDEFERESFCRTPAKTTYSAILFEDGSVDFISGTGSNNVIGNVTQYEETNGGRHVALKNTGDIFVKGVFSCLAPAGLADTSGFQALPATGGGVEHILMRNGDDGFAFLRDKQVFLIGEVTTSVYDWAGLSRVCSATPVVLPLTDVWKFEMSENHRHDHTWSLHSTESDPEFGVLRYSGMVSGSPVVQQPVPGVPPDEEFVDLCVRFHPCAARRSGGGMWCRDAYDVKLVHTELNIVSLKCNAGGIVATDDQDVEYVFYNERLFTPAPRNVTWTTDATFIGTILPPIVNQIQRPYLSGMGEAWNYEARYLPGSTGSYCAYHNCQIVCTQDSPLTYYQTGRGSGQGLEHFRRIGWAEAPAGPVLQIHGKCILKASGMGCWRTQGNHLTQTEYDAMFWTDGFGSHFSGNIVRMCMPNNGAYILNSHGQIIHPVAGVQTMPPSLPENVTDLLDGCLVLGESGFLYGVHGLFWSADNILATSGANGEVGVQDNTFPYYVCWGTVEASVACDGHNIDAGSLPWSDFGIASTDPVGVQLAGSPGRIIAGTRHAVYRMVPNSGQRRMTFTKLADVDDLVDLWSLSSSAFCYKQSTGAVWCEGQGGILHHKGTAPDSLRMVFGPTAVTNVDIVSIVPTYAESGAFAQTFPAMALDAEGTAYEMPLPSTGVMRSKERTWPQAANSYPSGCSGYRNTTSGQLHLNDCSDKFGSGPMLLSGLGIRSVDGFKHLLENSATASAIDLSDNNLEFLPAAAIRPKMLAMGAITAGNVILTGNPGASAPCPGNAVFQPIWHEFATLSFCMMPLQVLNVTQGLLPAASVNLSVLFVSERSFDNYTPAISIRGLDCPIIEIDIVEVTLDPIPSTVRRVVCSKPATGGASQPVQIQFQDGTTARPAAAGSDLISHKLPQVLSVLSEMGGPAQMDPAGGSVLFLQGLHFGRPGVADVQAVVGGYAWDTALRRECIAEVLNDTYIRLVAPSGMGADTWLQVSIVGQASDTVPVPYFVPDITAAVLQDGGHEVTVNGGSRVVFGISGVGEVQDIDPLALRFDVSIVVATENIQGIAVHIMCDNLAPISLFSIACTLGANAAGRNLTAQLVIGGVHGRKFRTGLYAEPIYLLGLQARVQSQLGGSTARLTLQPLPQGAHVQAFVGGRPCEETAYVTADSLVCVSPQGIGGGGGSNTLSVTVHGVPVISPSTPLTVSYSPPVVAAVSPSQLYAGNASAVAAGTPPVFVDVDILGSFFGPSGDLFYAAVSNLTVAGHSCQQADNSSWITWHSSKRLTCHKVPTHVLAPESAALSVLTMGSLTSSTTRLEVNGPPHVLAVSPAVASVGDRIAITATHLGRDSSSVQNVYIGDKPCTSWEVTSSVGVQCTVPAGFGSGGSGANVMIELEAGMVSVPNAFFSFKPRIDSISPNSLVSVNSSCSDCDTAFELEVCGSGVAGNGDIEETVVTLGQENGGMDIVCDVFELLVAQDCVRCRIDLADITGSGLDVSVGVGTPAVIATETDAISVMGASIITDANPAELSTSLPTVISVFGSDLASEGSPGVHVWVDEQVCTNVTVVSPRLMSCLLPPLAGFFTQISMQRPGGVQAVAPVQLAHAQPTVVDVLPRAALGSSTEGNETVELTVFGNNLGSPETNSHLSLTIGGAPCALVQGSHSNTQARCSLLRRHVGNGARSIVASVARVTAPVKSITSQPALIFSGQSSPRVNVVSPTFVGGGGGTVLQILGSELGTTAASIDRILVGSGPCTNVQVTGGLITCVAPSLDAAGLLDADQVGGVAAPLSLRTRYGLWAEVSPAALLLYRLPSMTGVTPSALVLYNSSAGVFDGSAQRFVDLTVSGSVLNSGQGLPGSGPLLLQVYGSSCQDMGGVLQVESDGSSATCSGLDTSLLPQPPADASASSVQVVAPDGTSSALGRDQFDTMGAPQITGLSIIRGEPGTKTVLQGENFGFSGDDVLGVWVGPFRVPPSAVEWESNRRISFTTPYPTPDGQLPAGVADATVIPLDLLASLGGALPITLRMRSGNTASPSAQLASFEYTQPPRPTTVSPLHVCMYRAEDDGGFGFAEWQWVPDTASRVFGIGGWYVTTASLPVTTGNRSTPDLGQIRSNDAFETTFVGASSDALQQIPVISSQCLASTASIAVASVWGGQRAATRRLQTTAGARLYRARIPMAAGAAWVSVIAATGSEAEAGDPLGGTAGPMAAPAGPLLPTCTQEQYLATQPLIQHAIRKDTTRLSTAQRMQAALDATAAVQCLPCPEGAVCRGAAYEFMLPRPGWARIKLGGRDGAGVLTERPPLLLECPQGELSCPDQTGSNLPQAANSAAGAEQTARMMQGFEGATRVLAASIGSDAANRTCAAGSAVAVGAADVACGAAMTLRAWSNLQDSAGMSLVQVAARVNGSSVDVGAWSAVLAGEADSPAGVEAGASCADGYTGPLCARCTADHSLQGAGAAATCEPCAAQDITILTTVGGLLGGLLLLSLFMYKAIKAQKSGSKTHMTIYKLLVAHMQLVAIAGSFPFVWPVSLSPLFSSAGYISSAGSAAISTDCLLPTSDGADYTAQTSRFLMRRVVLLTFPLFLLSLLLLFWFGVAPTCNFCPARADSESNAKPELDGARGDDATVDAPIDLDDSVESGEVSANPAVQDRGPAAIVLVKTKRSTVSSGSTARKGSCWQRVVMAGIRGAYTSPFIVSILTAGFLLHMSLTQAALDILTCTDVAGVSVLVGDYSARCDDPQVQTVQLMTGVPGLLLYAFGIPALGMALLVGAKPVLMDPQHPAQTDAVRTLGFVFADYRVEVPWWEAVVQVNKVGLAAVAVVLAPIGLASQATIGAHLALIMLVLQLTKQAYRLPIINYIAAGSLFVALLTLVGGQFLIGGAADTALESQVASKAPGRETVMEIVSVVVVTANAAFVGACLVLLLKEFKADRARDKATKNATNAQKAQGLETLEPSSLSTNPIGCSDEQSANHADGVDAAKPPNVLHSQAANEHEKLEIVEVSDDLSESSQYVFNDGEKRHAW